MFTMETEVNNELPFLRRSHKERYFRFQHPACIVKKPLLVHTGTFGGQPVRPVTEQELHVRLKYKRC